MNKVTQFEDDSCLTNSIKIGLTDIVKRPREARNEPSQEEYLAGKSRIYEIIANHRPRVLVFTYKRVLDNFVSHQFPTKYGFNENLENLFSGIKVFVCPLAGVGGVTRQEIEHHMTTLRDFLAFHIHNS